MGKSTIKGEQTNIVATGGGYRCLEVSDRDFPSGFYIPPADAPMSIVLTMNDVHSSSDPYIIKTEEMSNEGVPYIFTLINNTSSNNNWKMFSVSGAIMYNTGITTSGTKSSSFIMSRVRDIVIRQTMTGTL
jgi:hypothetical protein